MILEPTKLLGPGLKSSLLMTICIKCLVQDPIPSKYLDGPVSCVLSSYSFFILKIPIFGSILPLNIFVVQTFNLQNKILGCINLVCTRMIICLVYYDKLFLNNEQLALLSTGKLKELPISAVLLIRILKLEIRFQHLAHLIGKNKI